MTKGLDINALSLKVYNKFYRIPRLGMDMSDGGGAFGFDIHHALEVCYLIESYHCDAILETGTNAGDTTEFLAEMYPHLPVLSCDIEQKYIDVAKVRLKDQNNAKVLLQSSEKFLERYAHKYERPFIFLDAHWQDYWPLSDELNIIKKGVVCVDDCDIGDVGFGYDSYNGMVCNTELIKNALSYENPDLKVYVNDPHSDYCFPCQQKGRRGGRAYYALRMTAMRNSDAPFSDNDNFKLSEV